MRQVKSFLGLAGSYRRFILNFSSIASPLTDSTKKDRPNSVEDWQDYHEKAFQTLNNRLTSCRILRLPVFSRVIRLFSELTLQISGLELCWFKILSVKVVCP